jgi:hypothetical protein
MADRPDPYVRKDPNDIIRSGDWNELQIQAREHILRHTHTGRDDNGRLLPGAAIDPAADLSVRTLSTSNNLTVGGDLKVNGKALLGEIADLMATVKGLREEKLSTSGGTVSGGLERWRNVDCRRQRRDRHDSARAETDSAREPRCQQGPR